VSCSSKSFCSSPRNCMDGHEQKKRLFSRFFCWQVSPISPTLPRFRKAFPCMSFIVHSSYTQRDVNSPSSLHIEIITITMSTHHTSHITHHINHMACRKKRPFSRFFVGQMSPITPDLPHFRETFVADQKYYINNRARLIKTNRIPENAITQGFLRTTSAAIHGKRIKKNLTMRSHVSQ